MPQIIGWRTDVFVRSMLHAELMVDELSEARPEVSHEPLALSAEFDGPK